VTQTTASVAAAQLLPGWPISSTSAAVTRAGEECRWARPSAQPASTCRQRLLQNTPSA
jgi:hypothetical protein